MTVPTLEQVGTTLASLVPTGKQLAWLITAGASMFFAGVGATLTATEYRELPAAVDSLRNGQADLRVGQTRLSVRVDVADADRRRMLCLLELQTEVQVSGAALSPLEYNRRIADCENNQQGRR